MFNKKEAFQRVVKILSDYDLDLSQITIELTPQEQTDINGVITNAIWSFKIKTKNKTIEGFLDNISGNIYVTKNNLKKRNLLFSFINLGNITQKNI